MRVLPILFNTDNVRAILDGRKTVTRRLIKPQPDKDMIHKLGYCTDGDKKEIGKFGFGSNECGGKILFVKPPYKPGDILYVRETWQYLFELDGNEQIIEGSGKYYYAATDTIPFDTYVDSMGVTHERVPWHPSIHMPKEAARIFLKVKDVRVERLQDITEKQALAEGVPDYTDYPIRKVYCPRCHGEGLIGALSSNLGYMEIDCNVCDTAIKRFKHLWNSTIKKSDIEKYGWDANPYVWVIEFERTEP